LKDKVVLLDKNGQWKHVSIFHINIFSINYNYSPEKNQKNSHPPKKKCPKKNTKKLGGLGPLVWEEEGNAQTVHKGLAKLLFERREF
jgi:hypothetical protein